MKQNIKYYNESIKHFIDLSTKDATANIAKEHGIIGLTRLNICMEKLDLDISNNFFIALPDFTYTRNALRWNAGFPYGCIINIGQTIPFIPIDFRPNCCGIIFAEVPNQDYDIEQIQKKYLEIINSYDDINPNDFNKRNHFFGLYYNAKKNTYYFLIHGSFSFAKKSLYSEKNDDLMARVCSIDILGTPFHFLKNDDASLYYNKYLYFEKKSMYYRELILKELFPEAQILFHRTHEGFMDMGTILLGAYADNLPFMCPIMLSPEEDLPITNINEPVEISPNKILFCAPHGGGYALSSVISSEKCNGSTNNYIVTYTNKSKMLTNNIIDMPFYYRGDSAYKWCNEYKKGVIVDKLTPVFNLKI